MSLVELVEESWQLAWGESSLFSFILMSILFCLTPHLKVEFAVAMFIKANQENCKLHINVSNLCHLFKILTSPHVRPCSSIALILPSILSMIASFNSPFFQFFFFCIHFLNFNLSFFSFFFCLFLYFRQSVRNIFHFFQAGGKHSQTNSITWERTKWT